MLTRLLATPSRLARPLSLASVSASGVRSAAVARRWASSLVFVEHRDGTLNKSTLNAVTAAKNADTKGEGVEAIVLGGQGDGVDKVVEEVKKIEGLTKVYASKAGAFEHGMAESLASGLQKFLSEHKDIKHLFAAHTAVGKNVFPRLSGLLESSMIADIVDVKYDAEADVTEFARPIYAGNAILRVKVNGKHDPVRVVTVRTTAFEKANAEGGSAQVEEVKLDVANDASTKFVSEELTKNDRPDLASAGKVVSGGRALKSSENFQKVLEPIADSLGAAIGASRAAVDAGYADNSLQVGQTGKVVAPELYVAVGISGAIQHLAGMKESKMIVAINKDADAPIFQVADVGLVADLFQAVPELTEKIKAAKTA